MDDLSLIRADESSLNQDSIDRLQLSLSKRYNQSVFLIPVNTERQKLAISGNN